MNNTQILLERVRERMPRKSKNAVAHAIGAEESNVRRYYRGEGYPNPTHCIKIAEILGLNVADVILYVQEDKTRNAEQRETLRAHLPRLQQTIAPAVALFVCGLLHNNFGSATAEDSGRGSLNFPSHNNVYSVKSFMAWIKRIAQVKHYFRHYRSRAPQFAVA